MAKELTQFISKLKTDGIALTTHFTVELTIPESVSGNYNIQSMLMYCAGANLPSLNINTSPGFTYGENYEIPYDRLYDPLQMRFYVDKRLVVKKFFDEWIESIQSPDTRKFNFYNKFITKITVTVLDKEGKAVYKVDFFECYPKTIGEIQLDYSNANQIMTLPITFAYRYYKGRQVEETVGTGSFNLPYNYTNDFMNFQQNINTNVKQVTTNLKSSTVNNVKAAIRKIL